jgi:hypothetical protein
VSIDGRKMSMVISSFISDSLKDERVFVEARRIAANAAKIAGSVVRETYRSNCNVTLTAMHRLKPSRNPNSHEGSIAA